MNEAFWILAGCSFTATLFLTHWAVYWAGRRDEIRDLIERQEGKR